MEIPSSATALREAERSLLLNASAVLSRRYVHDGGGTGLSPAAAEQLASVLEDLARNESGGAEGERKEAIALAHRLIDDDHPEHSRMWPTSRTE